MTPIQFDAAEIETVAKLMIQYELDEYASDRFTLKKSKHKSNAVRVEPTAAQLLEKHLAPLSDAPWDSVPQEEADKWVEKVST